MAVTVAKEALSDRSKEYLMTLETIAGRVVPAANS
jgi:hypothetical protein